jgi:hypothetical protein
MVGWIIALALLAAAGIGTAVAVSAASANSDKSKQSEIADNQTNIYNTKKKNASLKKSADELEELQNKGDARTTEEDQRMQQLIDSLKQENEAWAELPDEDVLQEVKKEIIKNNDIIKQNTEENYKLALQMEDLKDKVAQQALISKLQMDQEELLAQKISPDDDIDQEAVAQSASRMAEKLVELNADALSEKLSTQEIST